MCVPAYSTCIYLHSVCLSIDKFIGIVYLQAEGAQDPLAMTGAVPAFEQREEVYDPLATPDVDK